MCWSMTNRAIGWCVTWYLRKGKIKWTRPSFVKEKPGYLGFFNDISSSLLFSNSLTVGWRDSDRITGFHLMVKAEVEKEKRLEQNLKRGAAPNHWDSWDCLQSLLPYLKGCAVYVCVCVTFKRHQTYRQLSCQSNFTISLCQFNNWRQEKVIAEKENGPLIYGH